jgi:hypothetical protein
MNLHVTKVPGQIQGYERPHPLEKTMCTKPDIEKEALPRPSQLHLIIESPSNDYDRE